MRRFKEKLASQLQYKIILPFLVLAGLIALVGISLAFVFTTGSWQERFDNQLAQAGRSASDGLVEQERGNLVFLQEATLALTNTLTSAPAVNVAMANDDASGLAVALDPFFQFAPQRLNVHLDRMIAFDRNGRTLVDWERDPADPNQRITNPSLDLSQTWFVPRVLAGGEDPQGDKFAGLLILPDTKALYLATIAPIKQGDTVVGGMVGAMRVETLLNTLLDESQAAIVTIYDGNGKALASTSNPSNGLSTLNIDQAGLEQLRNTNDGKSGAVYTVNEREYQFAYTPLQIRSATVGILSVALSRDYVVNSLAGIRWPAIGVTILSLFGVIALGVWISRRLTAPLEELAATATAVTAGDFERRSSVASSDEVGTLADSFNSMTEFLLRLYSERAAIVESIVDGIVVCDTRGKIVSVNPAIRQFLDLGEKDPLPEHFADLPLEALPEGAGFSERRIANLFMLNERIVRASPSEIKDGDGKRIGIVCVLQDMTAEVAVDQAKTNFIATISHELRTPLTVLRGNADLLLRGLMGPLDPEQRSMIETMRNHAANMTALVSNVIVIADLDSGSIVPEPAPTDLRKAIDDIIWPMRSQIIAKGLELNLDIPSDLPLVLVDVIHLRTALHQLLDNARRYTHSGTVTVRAQNMGHEVRIDVIDTGRGVSELVIEQLFERFIRGNGTSEGINSSERGIGLGLAIAKQLIERQGGRIWLERTSEQGSIFSFTLLHANNTPQLDKHSQAAA